MCQLNNSRNTCCTKSVFRIPHEGYSFRRSCLFPVNAFTSVDINEKAGGRNRLKQEYAFDCTKNIS